MQLSYRIYIYIYYSVNYIYYLTAIWNWHSNKFPKWQLLSLCTVLYLILVPHSFGWIYLFIVGLLFGLTLWYLSNWHRYFDILIQDITYYVHCFFVVYFYIKLHPQVVWRQIYYTILWSPQPEVDKLTLHHIPFDLHILLFCMSNDTIYTFVNILIYKIYIS